MVLNPRESEVTTKSLLHAEAHVFFVCKSTQDEEEEEDEGRKEERSPRPVTRRNDRGEAKAKYDAVVGWFDESFGQSKVAHHL
jgi:hypothetical protein